MNDQLRQQIKTLQNFGLSDHEIAKEAGVHILTVRMVTDRFYKRRKIEGNQDKYNQKPDKQNYLVCGNNRFVKPLQEQGNFHLSKNGQATLKRYDKSYRCSL